MGELSTVNRPAPISAANIIKSVNKGVKPDLLAPLASGMGIAFMFPVVNFVTASGSFAPGLQTGTTMYLAKTVNTHRLRRSIPELSDTGLSSGATTSGALTKTGRQRP
jgi:hypothetical protein